MKIRPEDKLIWKGCLSRASDVKRRTMIFIAFLLVLVFIFSLEQFHLVWFLVFEHFYFYFRLGLDVHKTVEIVKTSRKTQKNK